MARFPYHEENVVALGRLLAEAAIDPARKKRLMDDPATELQRIGLPNETTALFNFKVVAEEPSIPHAVLPYRLNQEKLAHSDPSYLTTIAGTVISRQVN